MSPDVQALYDQIYGDLPRQAPGSPATTLRAYRALPEFDADALALDVGCGAGGQTKTLAEAFPGRVFAFDLMMPFMRRLRADNLGSGFSSNQDGVGYLSSFFCYAQKENQVFSEKNRTADQADSIGRDLNGRQINRAERKVHST